MRLKLSVFNEEWRIVKVLRSFCTYSSELITSNRNYTIYNLIEKYEEMGLRVSLDQYPLSATFDLLLEEKNTVGMVDFYGTEDPVKAILSRPETNLCTDGLLSGKPHPRVYGSFPRVLGKYVRDEKVMSLEEAIYKMIKKPADTFHIKDRGQIKKGFYADLTLFDEHTVLDQGTFTDLEQYPKGIQYVLVNGQIAVDNGKETGIKTGRMLKREK